MNRVNRFHVPAVFASWADRGAMKMWSRLRYSKYPHPVGFGLSARLERYRAAGRSRANTEGSRSSRSRACLHLPLAVATAGVFACDDPGPQACGGIPPQTTYVGQRTLVEPCFEHPEMVELTLAAVSSNPGVAASEALGDKVQIVAVSPGTAAITVTATDPDGLTGELNFEAQVPNRPPENVAGMPAFRLEVGDPAVELVLSEYFVDPDGQLTYDATSSDTRVASVAVSADTLAVTGVSPGTATVTVTAADPGGLSVTAHVEALVLQRPRAPTLTTTLYTDEQGSADSVVLRWTPPPDTGSSAITRYRVDWRHNRHHEPAEWQTLGTTDPDVHRTPALIFGYDVAGYNFFRVRAVNAVGAGDPSNVDSVFVVLRWIPEPPRFTARKTDNGYRIYLQWEPSPTDTATIRRWAIDRSKNGGAWDLYQTPIRDRRAQQVGWPYVDSMRFRIRARYEGQGSGEWSNVVRVTWRGPDRPDSLAAAADGDSAVVLAWTAPADTGNSAVAGYMIETSSDGGFNWRQLVTNTGSTTTTYRHGDLAAGSTHLYVVSAINSAGIGPPSRWASAATEMNRNARLEPSTPVRLTLPRSKR